MAEGLGLFGAELVKHLIRTYPVVIVGKSFCPHSLSARQVLSKYHVSRDKLCVLEIENREDMIQIQEYLGNLTGSRNVPQIFVGRRYIGGGMELGRLDRSSRLRTLLRSARAI